MPSARGNASTGLFPVGTSLISIRNRFAPICQREPLVGSADIQSLAELANSFEVVNRMQPVPFGKETIILLVVATALPVLPLVLTIFPLDELIKRLSGILL